MPPGSCHQMLVNLVRRCLDGTLCQHSIAGPVDHPINPSLSLRTLEGRFESILKVLLGSCHQMPAFLFGRCLDGTLCHNLMAGPGEHPINPALSLRTLWSHLGTNIDHHGTTWEPHKVILETTGSQDEPSWNYLGVMLRTINGSSCTHRLHIFRALLQ